ncbi:hypothetical protein BDZ94DRAFT_1373254 [Collybia nuda]|uniref:RSE1/DDB1/CPSF1 first beta-propeller domain-containing protein n=1 Tax=Collybia nuda TaxID=64659 RepID=A0A9P5YG69_9AGAR|nr:hypothetical protein BDZ94DRAFT_1373254 [Collybia nuda]
MELYNLTLQPPSTIPEAIVGKFSGAVSQEFIISHGTRLGLLHLDTKTSSLMSAHTTNVFGSIRCIAPFRPMGNIKGEFHY